VNENTKHEHGTPFEWGENLHRRTVRHGNLLLAGLEGCRVYNPGAPFQYSEAQVNWQALWLGWQLRLNRLRYGRYLDILVTHAPPYGIHDARDLAHTGFYTYLQLMRRYRPLLMLHGHNHFYNRTSPEAVDADFAGVTIINTYGYRILELEPVAGGGWRVTHSSS
jgi:Icc-related predicted phosphoesterase